MEKNKSFNLRLTKEMWVFLKKFSIEKEKSMNQIIEKLLEKEKIKYEKRLD